MFVPWLHESWVLVPLLAKCTCALIGWPQYRTRSCGLLRVQVCSGSVYRGPTHGDEALRYGVPTRKLAFNAVALHIQANAYKLTELCRSARVCP
jgi:hypothetical protein